MVFGLKDKEIKASTQQHYYKLIVSQSTANDLIETGTHRSLRKPKAHFQTMMHVKWMKALRILRICNKHQESIKLKPRVYTPTYSKMKAESSN